MNKKAKNNEPHTQGEIQLSPEDVRLLRHFLEDYAKKAEKNDQPSIKYETILSKSDKEFWLGFILGVLVQAVLF